MIVTRMFVLCLSCLCYSPPPINCAGKYGTVFYRMEYNSMVWYSMELVFWHISVGAIKYIRKQHNS